MRETEIIGLLCINSCKDNCPIPNSELDGSWERVDGNNSPFNGMVVDFAGTNGILSVVPTTATGYEISDAKWRNVVKVKRECISWKTEIPVEVT